MVEKQKKTEKCTPYAKLNYDLVEHAYM